NDTGKVVASWPEASAAIGDDHASGYDFVVTRFRNAATVLPVTTGGAPLLPLATPISVQGAFVGVLVGSLRIATLGDALQAFAPGGGQSVFLVDATGALLAHPNQTLAAERPDWSAVPPVARSLHPTAGDPWV